MSVAARDWDVVVVGAGPAGSMTALLLARAGASVLLVDRQTFPRWKVCGSCLSAGTQEALRHAGLGPMLAALHPAPLHTLRLGGWGTRADVPLGPSVALSRAALDGALVDAATEAGAVFLAPARARLGAVEGARRLLTLETEGAPAVVRARLVVAADGVGSPLLSAARGHRDAATVAPDARIGFGALFPGTTAYGEGVIHMAVGTDGYVGLVRLEDGTLDVSAALDPEAFREDARPETVVARLLRGAGFPDLPPQPLAGWQGTPRLTRHVPIRGAERLLVVGDAAGYVEPFTGEGMGWALSGARALAPLALEAIRSWDPGVVAVWDRRYETTVGSAAWLCRGVSWALRRPALSRAGLRLVRAAPAVAAPFVHWAGRTPSLSQERPA